MSNPPNVPPKGEHQSNRQNSNSLNLGSRASPTLPLDNHQYTPTEAHPQHDHQQRIHLPGPNDNYRMPQPGRPFNGATSSISPAQQNPYHQISANLNRSKSLTRPERRRPRPGMIAQTNSIRGRPGSLRGRNQNNNDINSNRHSMNQPMSNNLQMQLAQQKRQQMANNGQPVKGFSKVDSIEDEELEKEASVLNNWWAWIAFLVTCCFPNYIIRHCFGKPNKNMQQAWREKVQ
jgi:chitin synthase